MPAEVPVFEFNVAGATTVWLNPMFGPECWEVALRQRGHDPMAVLSAISAA